MRTEEGWQVQLAVLSVSLLTILVGTALSPVLSELRTAFPQAEEEQLQLVLTIPALFLVPVSLISPWLTARFPLKGLLLAGLALYLIGGVGAGVAQSFAHLLFFRCLLGIGAGVVSPLAQGLISAYFTGEIRVRMTGRSAAVTYLMGILSSFSIGWLSRISWRAAFLVYGVTAIVLLLNLFFLPAHPPLRQQPEEVGGRYSRWPALLLALCMCMVEVAFYAFSTNVSLYVTGTGMGDVSTVSSIVSLFMLCGFLSGLAVERWRRVLRQATPAFGLLLMAGGYGLLCLSEAVLYVYLGGALIGASYSVLYASIFLQANLCYTNFQGRSFAISLITAGLFLGQFLSPACLRAVETVLGQSGYKERFLILFCALAIAVIAAGVRLLTRIIFRAGRK